MYIFLLTFYAKDCSHYVCLLYICISRIWEPGWSRYPRSSCFCCYYWPPYNTLFMDIQDLGTWMKQKSTKQLLMLLLLAPICYFIYGYAECGNLDGSDIHEAAAPAPTIGLLMLLYLWISRIWEPRYSIYPRSSCSCCCYWPPYVSLYMDIQDF